MANEIRKILDPRVLSAKFSQTPPADVLMFSETFAVNAETIKDNTYRSMYDPADLKPAPASAIGASAKVATFGDASERSFTMVNSANVMPVSMDVLGALREPNSYAMQDKAKTEIGRLLSKFARRQKRFRNLYISKALTTGVVYMDHNGNILASSSGATETADMQVAAGHQGTCGGLITDYWSNTSANIPKMLDNIDDAAAAAGFPVPTDVWVNKKNLQYLRDNDYFQMWGVHNPEVNQQVLQGYKSGSVVIQDLWGKRWHFVLSYYTDYAGTNRPHIPLTGTGSAVLTGAPGGEWAKFTLGTTYTPGSLDIQSDAMAALNNCREIAGEYAYAKLTDDPVGLKVYMGDKFGFNFNEPGAVWQAAAFA